MGNWGYDQRMSPDDNDVIAVDLHDMLLARGIQLDDDDDFTAIYDFLHDKFEPFFTRDRNYN